MSDYQVSFGSSFQEASRVSEELADRIRDYYGRRMSSENHFHLNFILRELLNNAVEHGNHFQEGSRVSCVLTCWEEMVEILVEDEAVEADSFQPPKACVVPEGETDHEKLLRERSRGLWMITQLGCDIEIQPGKCKALYRFQLLE